MIQHVPPPTRIYKFIGERLCLDFANTAAWHASDHPIEWLPRYTDLVAWGEQAGLLDAATAARLREEAARRPDDATHTLHAAVALREAIYCLFVAAADETSPDPDDMAHLNTTIAGAMVHARVRHDEDGGFVWEWERDPTALDQMLWPVVRSAAELLTDTTARDRIRQCESDDGCGWLFVDTTRNRSRRWCQMESCGNRAKARRHYARHHATPPPA